MTITEQKAFKLKTCQDVKKPGIHNILYVKSKDQTSEA